MRTRPELQWRLDVILPAGGLIEVVGRYGAGKTFLFIEWRMHVAAAMPWEGWTVKTPGPGLYVYGEGHMKPRVAAWRSAHRIPDEETVGVTYAPGTVNLLDDRAVAAFVAQIERGDLGP